MSQMDDKKSGKSPAVSDDLNEQIVKKELDTAINSLKKRIENLKGVDVKLPKRQNPFRD
ncbi:MAG: hypothetical protein RQ801_12625 [Spirochaetaceae bacterium]|nr:hypothetical protein [Spirochaetaceae bacterium]MDT8299144.1 hypothetical protein [Spirochaetaceae bacterium]